jgi:hypothetical protein
MLDLLLDPHLGLPHDVFYSGVTPYVNLRAICKKGILLENMFFSYLMVAEKCS